MIIKSPVCVDNSHWRPIHNWAVLNPPVYLGIPKATESDSYIDPTFVTHMRGLKSAGLHRGTFHFHRKAKNPIAQAVHFCATIRPEVDDKTLLVLDVEEGGESASQLKLWFEEVLRQYPHNQVMLYSSKLILSSIPMFLRSLLAPFVSHPLNAIAMSTAERDFFKRIPIWTAGYPFNPDLYNTVPSSYIPDPAKWGPVWMWQYTSEGKIDGAPDAGVDCNWLAPELIAVLGPITQPSIPYGYSKLRRYDSDVHIIKLESFIRAHVTNTHGKLVTVSEAAKALGAQYAVNGDGWGWTEALRPLSIAASEGDLYQSVQFDFRPFVDIQGSKIEISHDIQRAFINTVSGTRYLVRAGDNVFATANDPEHVIERHPRTAIGHTIDNKLILCVIDGRSSASAGVTLKELAYIVLEAGAVQAIEMDGGGSSAMWAGDRIVNIPSDGQERPVINHLLIFTEEAQVAYRYDATALGDGTRLRPEHNVNNVYLATYPKGTVFHGDLLWVAPADGVNVKAGDTWLEVKSVGTQVRTGWVAIKHLGNPFCTLKDNQVPEPDPQPIPATIENTVVLRDVAGVELGTWKGILTKQ